MSSKMSTKCHLKVSTKCHQTRWHFVDKNVHEMSPKMSTKCHQKMSTRCHQKMSTKCHQKMSTKCHPLCPRNVTFYVHEMSATHFFHSATHPPSLWTLPQHSNFWLSLELAFTKSCSTSPLSNYEIPIILRFVRHFIVLWMRKVWS